MGLFGYMAGRTTILKPIGTHVVVRRSFEKGIKKSLQHTNEYLSLNSGENIWICESILEYFRPFTL